MYSVSFYSFSIISLFISQTIYCFIFIAELNWTDGIKLPHTWWQKHSFDSDSVQWNFGRLVYYVAPRREQVIQKDINKPLTITVNYQIRNSRDSRGWEWRQWCYLHLLLKYQKNTHTHTHTQIAHGFHAHCFTFESKQTAIQLPLCWEPWNYYSKNHETFQNHVYCPKRNNYSLINDDTNWLINTNQIGNIEKDKAENKTIMGLKVVSTEWTNVEDIK